MKTIRTWVLVADAARATVLENKGRGTGLHAVDGLSFTHDSDASHELGRDRPSRTHQSVGPGRSSVEPKSDPHTEQKRDFARILADALASGHARHAFDKLVVVAPPAFLGMLRDALPKPVADLVTAEIAKDLTKTPVIELAEHLAEAVAL